MIKEITCRKTKLLLAGLATCFPGVHDQNDRVWSRINEKWIFVPGEGGGL